MRIKCAVITYSVVTVTFDLPMGPIVTRAAKLPGQSRLPSRWRVSLFFDLFPSSCEVSSNLFLSSVKQISLVLKRSFEKCSPKEKVK